MHDLIELVTARKSISTGKHLKPHQCLFVGVINVVDNTVKSPETVRDRILQAAKHVPVNQLGTTDDCDFSPFGDDVVQARDTDLVKIAARVEGTALALQTIGI